MRMLLTAFLALVLLCMGAQAFPLTGGNGIVNATVYGVAEKDSINGDGIIYYIDMSASGGNREARNYYSVVLIDSDDIAHGSSLEDGAMANFNSEDTVHLDDLALNDYTFRDTVQIGVPKGTIIKRLKIIPNDSDPFSIDWNGIPEVSALGTKLQFYSGQSERDSEGKYTWTFDVKVTNLGNDTATIPSFQMKDKAGWIYKGSNPRDKLLSREALRFSVTFGGVGAFSRPSELIFNMKPPVTFQNVEQIQSELYEDASMDIGAWV